MRRTADAGSSSADDTMGITPAGGTEPGPAGQTVRGAGSAGPGPGGAAARARNRDRRLARLAIFAGGLPASCDAGSWRPPLAGHLALPAARWLTDFPAGPTPP